ncbi:hypothetical protein CHELA20_40223 [Hyphomicrobiales bacterium]|nr:hypothetical protein CHELA20_40223 [Hyphomicrobiales bacterium]
MRDDAFSATRISPARGVGNGSSRRTALSGPPAVSNTSAFIALSAIATESSIEIAGGH